MPQGSLPTQTTKQKTATSSAAVQFVGQLSVLLVKYDGRQLPPINQVIVAIFRRITFWKQANAGRVWQKAGNLGWARPRFDRLAPGDRRLGRTGSNLLETLGHIARVVTAANKWSTRNFSEAQ